MEEIEIGEYVRTKDGHIAKYIKKMAKDENVSDGMFFDDFIYEKYKHIRYCFLKEMMVKHSKQLIDLIEIGDFVNGYRVTDKYLFAGEMLVLETKGNGTNCKYFCEKDIKIILTKEQYMANCYKVGGRDDN